MVLVETENLLIWDYLAIVLYFALNILVGGYVSVLESYIFFLDKDVSMKHYLVYRIETRIVIVFI